MEGLGRFARVCAHGVGAALAVDGTEFDPFGNPEAYHVLREHPGGDRAVLGTRYDRIPAGSMIHWFRCDRHGRERRCTPRSPRRLPTAARRA